MGRHKIRYHGTRQNVRRLPFTALQGIRRGTDRGGFLLLIADYLAAGSSYKVAWNHYVDRPGRYNGRRNYYGVE